MLEQLIKQRIIQNANAIGFDEFMELALYHPQYGYYRRAQPILGATGDFTTAPEISPLFGQLLAQHCLHIFSQSKLNAILEFGGGSGALCLQILTELKAQDVRARYFIIELSAQLKSQQMHTIKTNAPELFNQVIWLDTMPDTFSGVVIANEVLDAIPSKRFEFDGERIFELGVDIQNDTFVYQKIPTDVHLPLPKNALLPYQTECNLMIKPWLKSLTDRLKTAHILLIDYGYTEREYYHPQRQFGTVRCYYQHRANDNPFIHIGEQDITTSVNFSALSQSASQCGLTLAGFTTQAHFLINLGIEQALSMIDDEFKRLQQTQAAKQLLLPNAMGESFKVIAFNKNITNKNTSNKNLTLKCPAFKTDLSHKLNPLDVPL